jgi:deoxycytidylate deaminase
MSLALGNVIFAYHNERVCDSCNDGCIRTKLGLRAGERTEIGAEIHAEQAMLINGGGKISHKVKHSLFLAGLEDGKELLDPKPCPTCAKMLLYAGYKYYYTASLDLSDVFDSSYVSYTRYSIDDLVKEYEREARSAARYSTSKT